jgi:hypothetical protein
MKFTLMALGLLFSTPAFAERLECVFPEVTATVFGSTDTFEAEDEIFDTDKASMTSEDSYRFIQDTATYFDVSRFNGAATGSLFKGALIRKGHCEKVERKF